LNIPTLNALIIGPSGHGKSWLASTTPPPRLIIDLEGRAKYTPNGRQAVFWDGITDPMALERSPTRTYILRAQSLAQLDTGRQWLRSGKHPFKSVSVDSLMEAQIRVAEQIRPGLQSFRIQDFGDLNRHMQVFVREIKDMTEVPETGIRCAVFIAGAKRDEDGFIRPLMQGQISRNTPYWMDIVGYLERVRLENGQVVRRLWLDQRPENDLEVKDGLDYVTTKFGAAVINPSIEAMYNAVVEGDAAARQARLEPREGAQ